MEVVVLGNAAAYAGPGQACSGYLVLHGGDGLLIDCGNGVVSKLFEAGEQDHLTALLFTHLHADHLLDIFSLFYSRVYALGKQYPRLPVYLPPGGAERLRRLAEVLRVEPKRLFEQAFEPAEYDPDRVLSAGGLSVSFARNDHPVETFAVRVGADGSSVVYSSDTGPQARLPELARGCDLLISEATWSDEDFRPDSPIHLTPRLAAEVARDAGVGKLLLTHIWHGYDRTAMLAGARRLFENTELAGELQRYRVGGQEHHAL